MPTLNERQLEQRKGILLLMVKGKKERCPWLTMKQAADKVNEDLSRDPSKLKILNALAASTAK
jgi:hypothetical protein